MLIKVFFTLIFTLEPTASSSGWAEFSVKYFSPWFSKFFVEQESRMLLPELLLAAFKRVFWKGFCFFLLFLANIPMAGFSLFSWIHKVFTKHFAKQVLVMSLQQIYLFPQHFYELLRWVVESCENVCKICYIVTGLAQ